ncbi:ankyrin repeat-containing [Fusarium albosuccineum]|uniref:Ankyrin repeat-containing n=1 Tax=Fusarium albosuccineum TaxID=1237068 RepID=A0A8H4PKI1_9HYPO|nr:ankyrin repeat-containing [Fusarium albosuccineum]
MSDPVSVVGTAVGITSLGIQVCQGLVSYLHSLEGRNQEIKDGLRDIQTLVSIFYSLNGILPKIDERRPETVALRRCLKDSENKLLELQELLIKSRGPEAAAVSTTGKIDDARRALIYPFREGKLNSLRRSLRELLHNLGLAIDLTSLESGAAIRDAVETLGTVFKNQYDGLQDLKAHTQQNSDQLQSLDLHITDVLGDIEQRLSRTELLVQDLNQTVSGKLTLIGTDTRSVVSSNRRFEEGFAELVDKICAQSALMSRLVSYAILHISLDSLR